MSDRDTRPWRLVGYGLNEDGKETVRHTSICRGDDNLNTAVHDLEARADITRYTVAFA